MHTEVQKRMSAFLMLLLLFPLASIPMQSSIGFSPHSAKDGTASVVDNSIPLNQENDLVVETPYDVHSQSDISETIVTASGVLNPVQVEQSGYYSTGNITARTDTSSETENVFPIDTDHDWKASTAEIDIWNLQRLYVINGTFDEGIPGYTLNPNSTLDGYPYGWDAFSISTDPDQNQLVSYDDTGSHYVSVQNQAEVTINPQHLYTHFAGTKVVWNQTVDVTPYTDEFILSFDYLYLQGLLNPSFNGDFFVGAFIDGTLIYTVDLPSLPERGTWYSTGNIPITIAVTPGTTQFQIGLVINNTMVVDGDNDYDLDSFPDGATNTQIITAYLDDVRFVAATPPDCDEVSLEFSVNGLTNPIIGTLGTGSSQIVNQSYWEQSSLGFSITSNTSISFDYTARLLNHRFHESSSTTNTLSNGVAYTIESGASARLELYTYLGFLGVYEGLLLRIYHSNDWGNFTVFDPFLSDVTSSCTVTPNYIAIPESILDRLGWWKIICDSPNYASSAIVERYDSGSTDWVNETVFHSNDDARLSVSLGTIVETPLLSTPVNFTWISSNSTTWYESTTLSGLNGNASSISVTFGPTNTTAGIWGVNYFWSNGSELAYDYETFELHHTATLESVYSDTLDTLVGQPVSVYLRFRDAENGLYILNNGATVVGNWSSGDVEFLPDIVKNWWQADFDTALLGPGDYTIRIVSAAPYFETVPLLITIRAQSLASLTAPTGPLTPLIYGRQYSYDFFYFMSHNETGISGADVNVTEVGSEWATVADMGDGHYNLTLFPMSTGDYSIRITFSKTGYEVQSHVVSFLVTPVPMEVESISSLVGLEMTPLEVEVLIVESDTGNPVSGANVTMGVYRSGGDYYFDSVMEDSGSGFYTVTIPMPGSDTGSYTVRISVEKANHVMTQSFSAALVPTFDSNVRLFQTLLRYSWQIGVVAIVVVAVVAGQRARSRRNKRKHLTAVEIKHRFSDANNILGFLVLHKISGVPIYSKIFKGGLEEGLLSAFITAIMHFRTSFEKNDESDEYKIIPISEVIRVVPTGHLVCAFITMTTPSTEQEAKMRSYSRAIGMMFDESLAEVSHQVIDAKMSNTFEWMFDDFMDGILIRRYQVGEKKFPKPLRFIEKAIPLEEKDGSFRIHRLIRLLTSSGIPEDEVYIKITRAIDEKYILPVHPYNNKEQSTS
ncbi:MAG: hypothetical protein ACFFEK_02200 [Candidatus Thorarchaeota archaeon]